jgi:hypothetical protein
MVSGERHCVAHGLEIKLAVVVPSIPIETKAGRVAVLALRSGNSP